MTHADTSVPSRPTTAVDAVADRYVARLAELSPQFAVSTGLPGRRGELDDYSPAGLAAFSDLDRSTLRGLDGVQPVDDVDRVTVAAMRERLGVSLELVEAGEDLRRLDNITSPVQEIRDGFDNLPTATQEDWADFASTLRARTPSARPARREPAPGALARRRRRPSTGRGRHRSGPRSGG